MGFHQKLWIQFHLPKTGWFPDSPNLTRSPPRFPIPSMKSPICVVVCVVVTVVTLKKSWVPSQHFGLMFGLGEFSPTYKARNILAINVWSRNSEKAELKWNCSSAFYIPLSDSPSFLDHSKFIGIWWFLLWPFEGTSQDDFTDITILFTPRWFASRFSMTKMITWSSAISPDLVTTTFLPKSGHI